MVFAYLKVVLIVLICKANRITPEDCSDAGVYSGIARDRDNIFNAKTELLYCLLDSSEWNFFEMRKVSPLFSYGLL